MRRHVYLWGKLISAAIVTGVMTAIIVGLGSLSPTAWVVLVAAFAVAVVVVLQEREMRHAAKKAAEATPPRPLGRMQSDQPARRPSVAPQPVAPRPATAPQASTAPEPAATESRPVPARAPQPTHSRPASAIEPAARVSASQLPMLPAIPVGNGAEPAEAQADEFGPEPVSVEPADALTVLLESVGDKARVRAVHLWLYDSTTETVRLIESVGPDGGEGDPQPATTSIQGRAALSGRAVLERICVRSLDHTEITAWRFAVPLQAGEARGCVALDIADEQPDVPSVTRVVARMRTLLTAALALHVSRVETTAVKALVDAAADLLKVIDTEELLRRAVSHAAELCVADTVSIMLFRPGSRLMTVRASLGLPQTAVADTVVGEGEGMAGWVIATGKPLVVEDVDDRGPASRRHGIRSAMIVPIRDGDEVLGVINAGSRRFHARFSDSQLSLLESFGRILATALRNASALETTRDLYLDTVKALALALESKDPYSHGATERIYEITVRLAEEVGLNEEETKALQIGALLHDIGMAAAGEGVTASNRPLSTVEWGMLKMHPVIAAEVLEQAPALRDAVPIVYHHHERFDGQGYVLGLAGQHIPLGARVLCVADAYVAMTSPRPYRAAMTPDDALREIKELAGTQFDPVVVAALDRVLAVSPTSL